jgi:two-component system chemotaxis response regulator CheB
MENIRVLSVDDSALIRKIMREKLNNVDGIEVIATAPDPFIAAEKIKNLSPDVITLDIEMPRMDGITFLKKLMKVKPLPVIMVSSLTEEGAEKTLEAINSGAFDFILKPQVQESDGNLDYFIKELAQKIKSAGVKNLQKRRFQSLEKKAEPVQSNSAPVRTAVTDKDKTKDLIAIGASTGGTEVISRILTNLPPHMPGIVITQHMPPKFTKAFAERIDSIARISVKEAEDGEFVCNNTAYIAPGGTQMYAVKRGDTYKIVVNDDEPVNRHKPSVDALFGSIAENDCSNVLSVILTGMGADGASGMKKLKDKGSHTLAQDEKSSVIFGMPKEAIKTGGVDSVLDIEGIIKAIIEFA